MGNLSDLHARLGDLLDNRIPKAQRMTMAPIVQPEEYAELSRLLREAADVNDEIARIA